MKEWLYWHFPIITTRWRKNKYAQMVSESNIERAIRTHKRIEEKTTWAAINPVIHSLEELRADTWNQNKITQIQEWLRDNFEVKE